MQDTHTSGTTKSIKSLLLRIGLDEKQVQIYLALLSLKNAKASDVAKLSKQSRSHTYPILRSLEQKGLVSEIEENGMITFIAEPPERILNYLKDRERESQELQLLVEGAMPVLHSLSSSYIDTPRITTLKGLDGMKQIYRDILVHEFMGIINMEAVYNAFGQPIGEILLGNNRKYRGRDLFVDNEHAQKYLADWPSSEEYEIRLLPKACSFATDTVVFGDTVAIFAFDDDKTVISIDNKNIADTYRAWFELLWSMSREVH